MLQNKIVISSLEEDLQHIGLLPRAKRNVLREAMEDENPEDSEHEAEESPEEEEEEHSDSEEGEDSEDENGEDENGEDENGDSEEDEDSEHDHDSDEDEDQMDDVSQYNDDQEDSDDDHMLNHPVGASSGKLHSLSALKMGESKGEKINALLEDVQNLVSAVTSTNRREALKSFANISMISEQLARGFVRLSRALEEEDFRGVARTYRQLAEEAGNVALSLNEGKSINHLKETFNGHMSILVQGLDLYEDIMEACQEMSDSESEYEKDDDDEGGESDEDSQEDDNPSAGGDVHVDIIKNGSHDFGKKKKAQDENLY